MDVPSGERLTGLTGRSGLQTTGTKAISRGSVLPEVTGKRPADNPSDAAKQATADCTRAIV